MLTNKEALQYFSWPKKIAQKNDNKNTAGSYSEPTYNIRHDAIESV